MKLTTKHLDLYEIILDRGVGRRCNDLGHNEIAMLTPVQWKEFLKHYHDWNGDPEEYDERTSWIPMDFMYVNFIQHLIIKSYKETNGLQD